MTAISHTSPLFEDDATQIRGAHIRMAEALVFASAEPISEAELADRMPKSADISAVMAELFRLYEHRGVNLVRVGEAWAFRTAPDLRLLLARDASHPRKLSRAALEVLAIIAYHQPVTRAEIEEVRGVETSKGTLDLLFETEWVRLRGRRRTPGRPVTYGTTAAFLDQFGLEGLGDLPGADELKGAGLLSPRLPTNFSVPVPSNDVDLLAPDEDALTDIDLEELGLLPPRGGGD
ncbi:MAG: SMC-Scp complex subunit ScpB [Methylobacterium mesophilicum]|nr:SMC-Scp complex subunit ScpB [Methylobacterium mesophilicum]